MYLMEMYCYLTISVLRCHTCRTTSQNTIHLAENAIRLIQSILQTNGWELTGKKEAVATVYGYVLRNPTPTDPMYGSFRVRSTNFFSKFTRSPSDFDEIWHTCR